jgi:hypothetical protein
MSTVFGFMVFEYFDAVCRLLLPARVFTLKTFCAPGMLAA